MSPNTKNRTEKGFQLSSLGVNPHSKGLACSRSWGILSFRILPKVATIILKIALTVIYIIIVIIDLLS